MPNTSKATRPVLVTASVLVAAPSDEGELRERLSAIAQRLQRAVEQEFAGEADCEPVLRGAFHYLDDNSENARQCDRCGTWTTDVDQPDRLDALECGSVIGDQFLCEQCRVHLIHTGQLPDPLTGRYKPTK